MKEKKTPLAIPQPKYRVGEYICFTPPELPQGSTCCTVEKLRIQFNSDSKPVIDYFSGGAWINEAQIKYQMVPV